MPFLWSLFFEDVLGKKPGEIVKNFSPKRSFCFKLFQKGYTMFLRVVVEGESQSHEEETRETSSDLFSQTGVQSHHVCTDA